MGLLNETLNKIAPSDEKVRQEAKKRLEQLTMPHWALGRLMDLAEELAAMTSSLNPPVERKTVVVMAGDHGVTEEGVSQYPREVTPQMVYNFVSGGAGVNAIASVSKAKVVVVDMGVYDDLSPLAAEGKIISKRVAAGTKNMARGPAMSREEAIASIEAGITVALDHEKETDLFGTGEMGIGNTTPSSAIASLLTGAAVGEVTGRGTGIDEERWKEKVATIEKAIAVNQPDCADGIDVLEKVGGFEIGGIAGLILGAASRKKPVLVDGFIATAGALIAQSLSPQSVDYMICAHMSVEPGHRKMVEKLGKSPLLDLNLRLGEGAGSALAMPLVEAAQKVLTEVATFEEAAVSQSDK